MSTNIINLIKEHLGPALISQASTHLGESESGISKAISAFLPIVAAGFANNADKPGIIDSILGASSADLLGNPMEDSHNSISTTILTAIFGDKMSGVVNSVAGFAGINDASSSTLLNMVTSVTTGTLGKYASDNEMGSAQLSNLLSDQKDVVSTMLPAGFSLASLGLGHWNQAENTLPPVPENVTVTSYDEPKVDVTRKGETHMNVEPDKIDNGGSIWNWLLPLILVLLAGWFIWNQYNSKKAANTKLSNTDSTMMKSDTINSAMVKDSTTMDATPKTDTNVDQRNND